MLPWWWLPLFAVFLCAVLFGPLGEWRMRKMLRTWDLTPQQRKDVIWFFTEGWPSRWWFRWFAKPIPEQEEQD